MKVEQARKILVAAATMHADAGDREVAAALTEFAAILHPYNKRDLEEFVAHVAKLRTAVRR